MEYSLKQYACNYCCTLTEVLDFYQQLPNGWVQVSRFKHYCPECAKKPFIKKMLNT